MFGMAEGSPLDASPVPPISVVRTGVLDIAYHEYGDRDAFPVILLHGFPDDAHAYQEVAPALARQGLRAFAVYLRGFAPTKFVNADAPRTAQQAAIAQDVLDFADALGLRRFVVCGYDWGCRAAGIVSALHPDRVRAAVLMGGYTIQNTVTPGPVWDPATLKMAWFQWYFNTDAGVRGLREKRRDICRFLWKDWSPAWQFSEETFNAAAKAFDSPDFVDCVIHSYRHRSMNASGEARFETTELQLSRRPKIGVPAVILHGADSGFGRAAGETTPQQRADFPKLVARRLITGAGHFVPRERPAEVVAAVLEAYASST